MIALHGLWLPSSLHIWGEESDSPASRGRADGTAPADGPAPPGSAESPPHPFAVSADGLRAVVGDHWDGLLAAGASAGSLTLRLPSVGDSPRPSRELTDSPTSSADHPLPRLASWSVPCLSFAPADAIDLLTALPAAAPGRFAIGDSLRCWSRVAHIVVELLAAQRFVPDAIEEADGRHRAVWRVVLAESGGAGVTERLADLIAAMPPVCRAAGSDSDESLSVALVEDFLHVTTDAMVRRSLVDDRLVQSLQERPREQAAFEIDWLRALVGADPYVTGPAEHRAELARRVRHWISRLDEARGLAQYRTCFVLHAPPADDDDDAPWLLTFHMQSIDDPGVILEADRVWAARRRGLMLLRREYETLAEQLTADLNRAAQLFPPLARAAQQPEAVCGQLDVDEAYLFLREAGPLLELNGYSVRLPDWWQHPRQRLGLRLRVEPVATTTATSGSQQLGLDALVDYRWQLALGEHTLSEREFERLCDQGRSLVRQHGTWIEVSPEALSVAKSFLDGESSGQATALEAWRLSASDAARTGLPVIGMDAGGWIEAALNSVGSADQSITDLPQPPTFHGTLRPYQLKGLAWIVFLDRYGLGGCLADDMGLGKTIQLIALLLHERKDTAGPGPTLLVVPMSLVGNWQRELERFSPSIRVMIHHGAQRLSGEAFVEQVARHDVVISTYALAHRDFEHLKRIAWHRIALDEAQNIKNPSAKQTTAIRRLPCRRRVALTGTPLENHLSELWSIMEFLNPGLLGSATQFRRELAVPIEKHHESERADQLRRLIRPFVLRRRKDDPTVIVDLPEKMEMKVYCNLSHQQAALYQAIVDDMLGHIELSTGMRRRGLVLSALTRLKQVCDHPWLASHGSHPPGGVPGRSGKCERLAEMLEEVLAEGDRALVFTQFRRMGFLLEPYLRERLGCDLLYLHGQTSQPQRDAMVQAFQSDDSAPPVFLLSLRAGGFGLNLTAANHVFHFDRWWNPAVEDQASDRAHRIGQEKAVQVHKFVCIGTLEERIDRMLEEKRDLADRIIGSGEKWITELSTADLREVLTLSQDAVAEE